MFSSTNVAPRLDETSPAALWVLSITFIEGLVVKFQSTRQLWKLSPLLIIDSLEISCFTWSSGWSMEFSMFEIANPGMVTGGRDCTWFAEKKFTFSKSKFGYALSIETNVEKCCGRSKSLLRHGSKLLFVSTIGGSRSVWSLDAEDLVLVEEVRHTCKWSLSLTSFRRFEIEANLNIGVKLWSLQKFDTNLPITDAEWWSIREDVLRNKCPIATKSHNSCL